MSPESLPPGWSEPVTNLYERRDGLTVRWGLDGATVYWKTLEQQQAARIDGWAKLWHAAGRGVYTGFVSPNVHIQFDYPKAQLRLDRSAFIAAAHAAFPPVPTLEERVAALERRVAALEKPE